LASKGSGCALLLPVQLGPSGQGRTRTGVLVRQLGQTPGTGSVRSHLSRLATEVGPDLRAGRSRGSGLLRQGLRRRRTVSVCTVLKCAKRGRFAYSALPAAHFDRSEKARSFRGQDTRQLSHNPPVAFSSFSMSSINMFLREQLSSLPSGCAGC